MDKVDYKDIRKALHFSPWRPYVGGDITLSSIYLIAQYIASLYAVATNGKKYQCNVGVTMFITKEEKKKCNSEQLKLLKKQREKIGESAFWDFIEDKLVERTGLKGYRGYFKIRRWCRCA